MPDVREGILRRKLLESGSPLAHHIDPVDGPGKLPLADFRLKTHIPDGRGAFFSAVARSEHTDRYAPVGRVILHYVGVSEAIFLQPLDDPVDVVVGFHTADEHPIP